MSTFFKHCSFVKEASLFMKRYYTDSDFSTLKQSVSKKSAYTHEIDEMIGLLQEIYEQVLKQVILPDSLKILFEPLYDEEAMMYIADSILSADYEILLHEGGRTAIKKQFDKDHGRDFMESLFCDVSKFGDKNQNPLTMDEFTERIDRSDISVEMKWEVLRVYRHFHETVDQLFDVIEPLMKIMKPIYREYQSHFKKFYAFWDEICANGTFKEAIEHAVKLKIEDFDHITVVPSWMGCNSITMRVGDALPDDLVVMYIGLFFSDSAFFLYDQKISREELCSHLKLLSDPSKYEILRLVKNQACYGLQLAEQLQLTTATISHHVNALSNVGLLTIKKDASRIYYRMNKEQLGNLLDQLRNELLD